MNTNEKARWNQKYAEEPEKWQAPDPFLVAAYAEYLSDAKPGRALDVAGGAGRHAIWLARKGWQIRLVDISDVATGLTREKAALLPRAVAGSVATETVDLNLINNFGAEQYELIVVFFFLRRELFPALVQALKPGGVLIYKTYSIERAKMPNGPGDVSYLLQPNELLRAFSSPGLRVLHYHESLRGKAAAELVARRT
ncbi:MAG TPA: class I SAM-dependent methyltransferase [Verrucomicrobiae bacterium]|jgi:tellurite methyltransferase|nr:class I SAM-dependent methyltransferase [Verrucomicrobiae bacterium]